MEVIFMAILSQGGSTGSNASVHDGISKRDADRARYLARQAQRQQLRNARSHKRGFGTQSRSERFA